MTTETTTKTCKNDWCEKPVESFNYGDKALEGYCEGCQTEIRQGQYIDTLNDRLKEQVQGIATAIHQAARTLAELSSNEVYDVEWAEGSIGGDARDELQEMLRKVRNVQRCVAERQRMLKDAS